MSILPVGTKFKSKTAPPQHIFSVLIDTHWYKAWRNRIVGYVGRSGDCLRL